MIAELGIYALCWALLFAVLLVIIPSLGLWLQKPQWTQAADYYVFGQGIFVAISYVCLSLCFLRDDFTVIYVLANSSVSLPWFYKLCAVWGGHEGSMMLWVAILSLWMVLVSLGSRRLDTDIRVRVLVVLGALSIGFIVFVSMTSNPFLRQFTVSGSGRDLNPLLQDPGFLFHPPMLYMGYVGFAVAFSFAIAALWLGRMESQWAKWIRPWTLAAWCCLTLGITLGSWWAYRELGWGGWWFWDPVENASFMPWLVGTALLHSLMVVEKRAQFLSWSLLLAIAAFSLSLVGTFLVRSGVLTSVHAFAVDPLRGSFILLFLAVVIGGSLLLFACRAQTLSRRDAPGLVSRESALLLNNVFLIVMMLTVLLGTVYPLLIDGLGLGKLSVGAPYFNRMFLILSLPLLLLMGFGIFVRWQQDWVGRLLKSFVWVMGLSFVLPWFLLHAYAVGLKISDYLGVALAFWVIFSTLMAVKQRLMSAKKGLSQTFLGMVFAHLGLAVSVLGIAISSGYGLEDDVKMTPGDEVLFAGFRIQFVQESKLIGPNYHGTRASFKVVEGHRTATIYPEKRIYAVGSMPMTESAIDVTPFRDVYVALGEALEGSAWSVRLYYKPLVRFIWGGGLMMCLGGLLALTDRRYYTKKSQDVLI